MFMINEVYKLKIYSTESNKEPFTLWLNSLEKPDRAKVRARLDRIIVGNFGEYKHIYQEIYELKFKSNSGFRVYYAIDGDKIILLLSGGNKSTQSRDIKKAKEYWNNYNARKAGE